MGLWRPVGQQIAHGTKACRLLESLQDHQRALLAHAATQQFGAAASKPLLGIGVERPGNESNVFACGGI